MLILLLLPGIAHAAPAEVTMTPQVKVEEALDIAAVPSGFPVGFSLLTAGNHQYVAYYDTNHRMTVASRTLDSNQWRYQILPSEIGWDSHNYITMAMDDDGHLHLSGNMHCVPLIYFRTSTPGDITTLSRIAAMTGQSEDRCTYPQFMRDAENRLIFHYRDGSSGNGNEIYNVYDLKTRSWSRLLDTPLIDGQGRMNAYMAGPARGPDGWFHLCWVWRDTGDCRTNHDPSYARSRDLIQWETVEGTPIALPITFENQETIIDPVPAGGGIINGALRIGFDRAKRPIASYHKFDRQGKTQVYVARAVNGKWEPRQVTDWDYRWEFQGGGSIIFEIRLGAVRPHGEGQLALPFDHVKYGNGLLVLDEKSLSLLGTEAALPRYPKELSRLESATPNMQIQWAEDAGKGSDKAGRYVLRWETLPHHRDRPRQGPLPEPSMLRLYRLSTP